MAVTIKLPSADAPQDVGNAPSAGATGVASDAGHVHAHGAHTNPADHALATSVSAGFISGPSQAKLDGLPASAPPTSRVIVAGDGLVGGGDLSADRTIDVAAVDASIDVQANGIRVGVVSDAQHGNRGGGALHADATTTVSGFFTGPEKVKLAGLPTSAVPTSRQIIAGNGLIGGGDLTADRTINVAAANASITVAADSISVGVINDTQHGNRGGGLLHTAATAAVPGFALLANSLPNPVTTFLGAVGTSARVALSDHSHAHGNHNNGAHHAIATVSNNGFFSSSDRYVYDTLEGGPDSDASTYHTHGNLRRKRTYGVACFGLSTSNTSPPRAWPITESSALYASQKHSGSRDWVHQDIWDKHYRYCRVHVRIVDLDGNPEHYDFSGGSYSELLDFINAHAPNTGAELTSTVYVEPYDYIVGSEQEMIKVWAKNRVFASTYENHYGRHRYKSPPPQIWPRESNSRIREQLDALWTSMFGYQLYTSGPNAWELPQFGCFWLAPGHSFYRIPKWRNLNPANPYNLTAVANRYASRSTPDDFTHKGSISGPIWNINDAIAPLYLGVAPDGATYDIFPLKRYNRAFQLMIRDGWSFLIGLPVRNVEDPNYIAMLLKPVGVDQFFFACQADYNKVVVEAVGVGKDAAFGGGRNIRLAIDPEIPQRGNSGNFDATWQPTPLNQIAPAIYGTVSADSSHAMSGYGSGEIRFQVRKERGQVSELSHFSVRTYRGLRGQPLVFLPGNNI